MVSIVLGRSGIVHFSASQAGWPELVERAIPDVLLQPGPLLVLWWQWIALVATLPLLVFAAWLIQRSMIRLLRRLAGWTGPTWDDAAVPRLRGPVLLFWIAVLLGPATTVLELSPVVHDFLHDLAKALVAVSVFWGLVTGVGLLEDQLLARAAASGRTEGRWLVPFGANVSRLLLLFLCFVAVLSQFGYPVTTLLAGLGIGGVAVALGAQKTFENLLGSVAISIDRPFRVGDWIESEGMAGTVEEIGLRSTRIRTFARTVITIPNGRLADQRIERHTARDRWLWNVTFGVTYDTTVAQVAAIAADVEQWLTTHPKIASGNVKFSGFGDHSLDIEVLSWFNTTDFWEFRQLRQNAGLEIMRLVERNGARLAVPMQRVFLASGTPQNGDAHPQLST